MPRRNHEYHRPNAPDTFGNDSESDIELDLDELGPSDRTSHGRGGRAQDRVDNDIPLRIIAPAPFRASGRRTKRYETDQEQETIDGGREATGHRQGADSVEGLNIGDSTPLLDTDAPGQAADNSSRSRTLSGRMRFLNLRARRDGYTNIQENPSEGSDESSRSAPRSIDIGQYPPPKFPPNAISNAKYTPWSFLPRTLYNEFSFFINLYFLLVALSQIIEALRIGVLWTYFGPLAFVLTITLGKEAYDDVCRRRRDAEANRELYTMLALRGPKNAKQKKPNRRRAMSNGQRRLEAIEEEEQHVGGAIIEVDEMLVKAKDIKVGDVLRLGKKDRVPADVVILKSFSTEIAATTPETTIAEEPDLLFEQPGAEGAESQTVDSQIAATQPKSLPLGEGGGVGEAFIRTDQLDGETDWKLRIASPLTQPLDPIDFTRLTVVASKPSKKVNEFMGRIELQAREESNADAEQSKERNVNSSPLTIDNTAWANTVLASSAVVYAVVVYTGAQTRQALSTAPSRSKVGLLELEINNLTKILCALTVTLSGVLVLLQHLNHQLGDLKWSVSTCRYLILFSSIIPIALRLNLDLGKTVYAYYIQHDRDMPEAVVRTSTIPEDLGRIEYLLSDKTGTLTQNDMDLRKIHVGTVSYANEAMDEVSSYIRQGFGNASTGVQESASLVTPSSLLNAANSASSGTRTRREIGTRVRDVVLALALCHSVTPTTEDIDGHAITSYQASSPDEIAIVRWTESVGIRVVHRDRHNIALQSVDNGRIVVRVRILDVFPFTSEGKRMGIVLQYFEGTESTSSTSTELGEIWFYQKGADTVMSSIVAANDWLDEETANMAREGLRTLVVGRRKLSPQQYADFATSYKEASLSLESRDASMAAAIKTHLEHNLELLGVTGVEDKLQENVKASLELLRNAGIKIWMLTGDKVETARCVAISSKLVSRTQHIHTITALEKQVRTNPTFVSDTLSLLAATPGSTALLIDGDSLSYLLLNHRQAFISLAVLLPAVIACRCSPTQKADVALLIRKHTKKRIACIGDGGNDVSMIQAADVGVGIVGKEGRQASLAADFSITQFHHLTKLLVWHGRNSYKRSAKLGQFVIHRGLVISIAQTVFSISAKFQPNALFRDWLLVGYATAYTQLPVFSLVLDRDVDEEVTNLYPELYKELTPGTSLSYRTFFMWLFVSIYQGCVIQLLTQLLVSMPRNLPVTSTIPDPSNINATITIAEGKMTAVSFSALVINELVMVAMEVTTWHWIMMTCIAATFVIYVSSVPLLGDYFDLNYVWSGEFVWKVVVIAAVSLVPTYIVKVVRRTVKPPSYRKVRGV